MNHFLCVYRTVFYVNNLKVFIQLKNMENNEGRWAHPSLPARGSPDNPQSAPTPGVIASLSLWALSPAARLHPFSLLLLQIWLPPSGCCFSCGWLRSHFPLCSSSTGSALCGVIPPYACRKQEPGVPLHLDTAGDPAPTPNSSWAPHHLSILATQPPGPKTPCCSELSQLQNCPILPVW